MDEDNIERFAYYQDENGLCLVRIIRDLSDEKKERYWLRVEEQVYLTGQGKAFMRGREFEMERKRDDFSGKKPMIYFNHSKYGLANNFLKNRRKAIFGKE